jgi:hypothetical protein
MKRVRVFAALILCFSLAQTALAYDSSTNNYVNRLFARARALNADMLEECENCTFASSPAADPVCRDTYNSVFVKREVNIHIAFGYMDDSENAEGDYFAGKRLQFNESIDDRALGGLIHQLVQPCRDEGGACGFTRDALDQKLLRKTVNYRGQTTLVQLHVTNGSATPILSINTAEGQKRQALATWVAEQNFFGSLDTSDLTIYTGHARSGGGPDFNPPVRRGDGHPDYEGYYRVKTPGLKRLVSALRGAKSHPKLLALIACKSDDLFRTPVLRAAPGMGFMATSDLMYFDDGFINTFLVLDGFLRQECDETFQRTLATLKTRNGSYIRTSNFLTAH